MTNLQCDSDEVARSPVDGPVSVRRVVDNGADSICVQVTTMGQQTTVLMTEYNARRVLGMLSLILELPLTKQAQSKIKF